MNIETPATPTPEASAAAKVKPRNYHQFCEIISSITAYCKTTGKRKMKYMLFAKYHSAADPLAEIKEAYNTLPKFKLENGYKVSTPFGTRAMLETRFHASIQGYTIVSFTYEDIPLIARRNDKYIALVRDHFSRDNSYYLMLPVRP